MVSGEYWTSLGIMPKTRILFQIIWSDFAFEDLNISLNQAQTRFSLTLTTPRGDHTHFWAGSDGILCLNHYM